MAGPDGDRRSRFLPVRGYILSRPGWVEVDLHLSPVCLAGRHSYTDTAAHYAANCSTCSNPEGDCRLFDLCSTGSSEPGTYTQGSQRRSHLYHSRHTFFAERYSTCVVNFCFTHATSPAWLDDRIRTRQADNVAADVWLLFVLLCLLLPRCRVLVAILVGSFCRLPRGQQDGGCRIR